MKLLFLLFKCLVLLRIVENQLLYLVLFFNVLLFGLEKLLDFFCLEFLKVIFVLFEFLSQLYLLNFKFFYFSREIFNFITLVAD